MKCLPSIVFSLMVIAAAAAQSLGPTNSTSWVTLSWLPGTNSNYNPSQIARYTVYEGTASLTYTNTVQTTNTTLTFTNAVRGTTYFFNISETATNGLDSPQDTEVSWTSPVPPPPPTAFHIIIGN